LFITHLFHIIFTLAVTQSLESTASPKATLESPSIYPYIMPAILSNSLSCSSRISQRRSSLHRTGRSSPSNSGNGYNKKRNNINKGSLAYYFDYSSSCSSSRSSSSSSSNSPRPSASIDSLFHSDQLFLLSDRTAATAASSTTTVTKTKKSNRQRVYLYFPQENKDQSHNEEWGHFVEV
jgi:hypothetical protein